MNPLRPMAINGDRRESKLIISWSDGHESSYTFSLLRHACPCAECCGGHANMRSEPDEGVFYLPEEDSPSTHLENIQPAGAYALTFEWEDGHIFGIYTWSYLRKLCPCDDCRGDYFLKGAGQR